MPRQAPAFLLRSNPLGSLFWHGRLPQQTRGVNPQNEMAAGKTELDMVVTTGSACTTGTGPHSMKSRTGGLWVGAAGSTPQVTLCDPHLRDGQIAYLANLEGWRPTTCLWRTRLSTLDVNPHTAQTHCFSLRIAEHYLGACRPPRPLPRRRADAPVVRRCPGRPTTIPTFTPSIPSLAAV